MIDSRLEHDTTNVLNKLSKQLLKVIDLVEEMSRIQSIIAFDSWFFFHKSFYRAE